MFPTNNQPTTDYAPRAANRLAISARQPGWLTTSAAITWRRLCSAALAKRATCCWTPSDAARGATARRASADTTCRLSMLAVLWVRLARPWDVTRAANGKVLLLVSRPLVACRCCPTRSAPEPAAEPARRARCFKLIDIFVQSPRGYGILEVGVRRAISARMKPPRESLAWNAGRSAVYARCRCGDASGASIHQAPAPQSASNARASTARLRIIFQPITGPNDCSTVLSTLQRTRMRIHGLVQAMGKEGEPRLSPL